MITSHPYMPSDTLGTNICVHPVADASSSLCGGLREEHTMVAAIPATGRNYTVTRKESPTARLRLRIVIPDLETHQIGELIEAMCDVTGTWIAEKIKIEVDI